VFVAVAGVYRLLGVVSETMVSDNQLKPLEIGKTRTPLETILGLGILVKQRHVIEMLGAAVEQFVSNMKKPPRRGRD
jgi:hypothetical protein